MKRILIFVFALFLAACSGSPASHEIEVRDAWARAAVLGDNGAAYMTIHNGTYMHHELIGVSSDVAEATEIHLSAVENDVMKMTPQTAVSLPVGEDVEFKPGALHVMFVNLKRDLKVGDEITLTLMFKDHADIVLTIPVKDAADMGGSGMDGHHMP